MTLEVKGIVNGGLRKRWAEPGDRCCCSTPDGLMRILGTIIRTLIVDVLSRQASDGDVIGPEFIGCDPGLSSLVSSVAYASTSTRLWRSASIARGNPDLAFIVDLAVRESR